MYPVAAALFAFTIPSSLYANPRTRFAPDNSMSFGTSAVIMICSFLDGLIRLSDLIIEAVN
ncbi:hypothetical protein D3C78_1780680 [compost metagenome]